MKSFIRFILLGAVLATSLALKDKSERDMRQATWADRARVYGTIFAYHYDPEINPDNLQVNVSLLLQSYRLDEEHNILETDVWVSMEWIDERLRWNPESYGDMAILRVSPGKVWKPDLSLYNSADSVTQMNCWKSKVQITSKGKISTINPCKLKSYCKFTLKQNPWADQACKLKLGSWTMDGSAMDLQVKDQKLETVDVTNPYGWQFVDSSATRNSQVYNCCEEPYIDITYNLTFRRLRLPQYLSTL